APQRRVRLALGNARPRPPAPRRRLRAARPPGRSATGVPGGPEPVALGRCVAPVLLPPGAAGAGEAGGGGVVRTERAEGTERTERERTVIPRERERPRDLARIWLEPFPGKVPRFARDDRGGSGPPPAEPLSRLLRPLRPPYISPAGRA